MQIKQLCTARAVGRLCLLLRLLRTILLSWRVCVRAYLCVAVQLESLFLTQRQACYATATAVVFLVLPELVCIRVTSITSPSFICIFTSRKFSTLLFFFFSSSSSFFLKQHRVSYVYVIQVASEQSHLCIPPAPPPLFFSFQGDKRENKLIVLLPSFAHNPPLFPLPLFF